MTGLRPDEIPFLQPLDTDPESASIPDQNLQPIALAVAEQEEVSAQRFTRQSIPKQTVQLFEPLAHVGNLAGQIDPCGWAKSKHDLRPLQDAANSNPFDHPTSFSSVLACGGKCSRLFGRATAWADPLGDEGGAGVHGVIATSCSG